MDASLTLLQTPPESPGSTAIAGTDLFNKQEDVAIPGEFGALLDQVNASQLLQPAGNTTELVDVENISLQLQSLPQGGKLLPLLQQALESGELSGADKQQLIDQIAARLEQAQSASELNQGDDITGAIYQLLINVSDSQTVAVPQGAVLADIDSKLLKSGSVTAEATGRALATLPDKQTAVAEADNRPLSAETLPTVKNTSLDNALAQIQQQSPESSNSELASLMTAFKRQVENPAKSADTLLRADSATTAVTAPVTVQPPAAAPSGLPTIALGTPLNQGNWDQALGERIQWMAGQKLQGAQIRLNPANLGPMEVRIQVQNEQASIQFTSAHGVVREALEAALPRLREMFDASGVELVNVDVSGQSFAEQQRSAGEGASAAWGRVTGTSGQDMELEPVLETPLARVLGGGRLDLFV